jgi:hypothetical protein
MGEFGILLLPFAHPDSMPGARLRVEIVSGFKTVPGCPELTVISSYRRTYKPASYHIAQELQKYNIPDYRPRQEQYVYRKSIPKLNANVIAPVGSRRPSRKCVLCRGCDEIAGSLSVKPRTAQNKIRQGSFGLTIHPRVLRGPPGINCHTLLPLLLDVRTWTSIFHVTY